MDIMHALTCERRGRTVDALSTLPALSPNACSRGYDAWTMRLCKAYPVSLIAMLGALIPTGMLADVLPSSGSPIDVSAVAGRNAVRVAGTVAGAASLRAALYASFAADVPVVLLNRRLLKTDAAGHFDAIIPLASATFDGAIVTVVVQTAAGVVVGRGRIVITDSLAAADHVEPRSSPHTP